jgi:hypothetical protein
MPITRRISRLLPLFCACLLPLAASAQCALTCNSGLQVSLDPAGQALITTAMIAPNAGNTCPGPLTLTLYNELGQQLPNPLTCDQIGVTVTARVRHTASGNFCNGTLEVNDALSPTLGNCNDRFVFCNEDTDPAALGYPTASDNCTPAGNLDITHLDTETPLGCGVFQNGVPVLRRIDRRWSVTDQHGNSSTCLQRIWLKHITFADLTFPPNRDGISAPELDCTEDPNDLDIAGQPTVNGVPVGAGPACELVVAYSDQTVQHCAPAGYTILRSWTAIDFCSGNLSNRIQIIKVTDRTPPALLAPDNLTVATDGFYCSGSVTMPQATVTDNCSAVSVTPSFAYGTGYGPFYSVPEGEHVVTYTATDACGNTATATMTVSVLDLSPPQAICASDLQISLTSNGLGYVNAATVNAGSFDNCGPVFLSISRDEVEFLPQVQVSCADQGAPMLLTLRVTDVAGLENFCQMEVTVRDFLKPNLQCPPHLTLHCLQDYEDLGLTGQATATDNCAMASLTYQDFSGIQPCNIGGLTRWWIATDSAGNSKSCSQQITVEVINTTTVAFPANITVNACGSPDDLLPVATGQPVLGGQSCSPLSVNYTDQIFSGAGPTCFRIFRSWKVIDHCIYNPNGGSAGIWEQIQIIDVHDQTPPVLLLPPDLSVAADPNLCAGVVSLPDVVVSDCSNQITISHNSPYAGAGQTVNVSGLYPHGVHFVVFTATDDCGNSTQQTLRITVQDQTPPTAVCLTGVSANIGPAGVVTLQPQNFDGGCVDPCSPQNSLIYSLSPAQFDCSALGLHVVTLTVEDTAGLTGSCQTQVLIKDPGFICLGGGLIVEGRIITETGAAVHGIPVSLTGDGYYEEMPCDTTGRFVFQDIPANAPYVLQAQNNANWLNGVTTYDLVLISRHILGYDTLDSPYQMIAADANRSGSITTFDIVQLRKIILGILDSMPNNTSWRFVDSAYVFPNPLNPFGAVLPENMVFQPLTTHQFGKNFIGIKVGDVNGTNNPADARDLQDTLYLLLPDRQFEVGEQVEIPLNLENWSAVEGFQGELFIDPSLLVIESIAYAHPDVLNETHIAPAKQGGITLSWNRPAAAPSPAPSRMLTLHARALAPATLRSAIALRQNRLRAEVYRPDAVGIAALSLHFDGKKTAIPGQALAVYPNPAVEDFSLENPFGEQPVTLRIVNAFGQIVVFQQGILPEKVRISLPESQNGLFFISLCNDAQCLNATLTRMAPK